MYLWVFALVAFLELAAAVSVYLLKSVMHATIALAMVFLFNSLMFLVLGQPLLAVIQAFVVIGGIATYLIVGTATAQRVGFKHVRVSVFVAMLLLFTTVLNYSIYGTNFSSLPKNSCSATGIEAMLSSIGLLYIIVLMLFGVSIGSIVLFKRFKKIEARGE